MQILDGDYEKLHLPRGESFLWIDQLDGTMARGVVIPNDDRTAAAVVAIRVEFAPDMPARSFSEARWLFNPNDDDLWYACGPNECCIIPGGDPGGP